jgi:hypothetical protein
VLPAQGGYSIARAACFYFQTTESERLEKRHHRRVTMSTGKQDKSLNPRHLLLNIAIAVLSIFVVYLVYSLVNNTIIHKPVEWTTQSGGRTDQGDVIQLDVLNGCGVSGVAQKFTDYLRKRNFDVVQSSNYRTFDVEKSLVIDRTGDVPTAKKVANALGIDEKNILQQINPDYYLHVSVVIGRDYQKLKPFQ